MQYVCMYVLNEFIKLAFRHSNVFVCSLVLVFAFICLRVDEVMWCSINVCLVFFVVVVVFNSTEIILSLLQAIMSCENVPLTETSHDLRVKKNKIKPIKLCFLCCNCLSLSFFRFVG